MADGAYVTEANYGAVVRINSPAIATEANFGAVVKVQATGGVTEANFGAVVFASPCASQRCDLWMFKRVDGRYFCFTSFDEDLTFGPWTFKHCGSLGNSAATASSNMGEVGSQTLIGILDNDEISEDDLYGGLWDDAFVQAWHFPWGAQPDSGAPFSIASGYLGKITRKENSWEADVQGAGAKLAQTALVSFYQPGCRWHFGDAHCAINAELYRQEGITVTDNIGRGILRFHPELIPSMAALWNEGTLIWRHGRNAGISLQCETVDWESGVLSLWDLCPFPPAAGDTFDLLPGCEYSFSACQVYNNVINFGGFPNVPGPDFLQQNADAIFSANSGN